MPVLIVDHQLNDFDEWIAVFKENPPPSFGSWKLLRGSDDPNRVYVIQEYSESQLEELKDFVGSNRMKAVFEKVNAMSKRPIEFVWLDEVKP